MFWQLVFCENFPFFSVFLFFVLTVSVLAFSQAQSCVKSNYLRGQSSGGARGGRGHRPSASACFLALSLRSAMLEFLLLLLAAAATAAAAEAESASDAIGSPKGGGGNIR